MPIRRRLLLSFFVLTFVTGLPICRPADAQTQNVFDIAKDSRFQPRINIEIAGRPLYLVLETISKSLPVDLRINDPKMREQRVTLFFQDKPAWMVLKEIVAVLSHGSEGRPQYRWTPGNPGAGKPVILLIPERAAALAEEEDRQRPWREVCEDLTLYRNILLGRVPYSAAESSPFGFVRPLKPGKIEGPLGDFGQKLTSLTDAQFAAFLRSEPLLYMENSDGHPPQTMYIQLQRRMNFRGRVPEYWFASWPADSRRGGVGLGVGREAYRFRKADGPVPELLPVPVVGSEPAAKIYDLGAEMKRAGFADKKRVDFATRLLLLAKLARVELVEEHFIHERVYDLPTGNLEESLRGTLPELFNRLCRAYGYQVRFEGGVYRFWSDIWGILRLGDIPEKQLARWVAYGDEATAAGRTFVGADYMAVAADLRFEQFATTLQAAVPRAKDGLINAGQYGGGYNAVRIISLLSEAERRVARSEIGLPVRVMSPRARQVILTELDVRRYHRDCAPLPMRPVSDALILASTLHLPTYGDEYNPDNKVVIEAEAMTLTDPDGALLWRKPDYE